MLKKDILITILEELVNIHNFSYNIKVVTQIILL